MLLFVTKSIFLKELIYSMHNQNSDHSFNSMKSLKINIKNIFSILFSLSHLDAWFLGVIPFGWSSHGRQHTESPEEDGGQEQCNED